MRSSVLFQSCVTQNCNITLIQLALRERRRSTSKIASQYVHVVSIPPQRSPRRTFGRFLRLWHALNVDVIRISVVIKELLIISLASWFAYPRIFWYNRQQHTYLCLFICTVHLPHSKAMATAIATQQQPIYPSSFPSSKEQRAQHLQYLQSFAYQSTQVRSKFFQRIGITSPLQASAPKHRRNNSTRDILSTNRFEVPLKYKYDHKKKSKEQHQIQQLPSSLMKILPSHPEGKKKRSVGFAETVTVAPIPMRNEYSDRIKAKLWSDRVELCEAVGKLISHNMISYVHNIVSDSSHTICSLDLHFFINEHISQRET